MISLDSDQTLESLWKGFGECYKSSLIQNVSIKQGDKFTNTFTTVRFSKRECAGIEKGIEEEYLLLKQNLQLDRVPELHLLFDVDEPAKHFDILVSMKKSGSFLLHDNLVLLREGYANPTTSAGIFSTSLREESNESLGFQQLNFPILANSLPSFPDETVRYIRNHLGIFNPVRQLLSDWLGVEDNQSCNAMVFLPVYVSSPHMTYGNSLVGSYSIHPKLLQKTQEHVTLVDPSRGVITIMAPNKELLSPIAESGLDSRELYYQKTDAMINGREIRFVVRSELGELVSTSIAVSILLPKDKEQEIEKNTFAGVLDKLCPFIEIKAKIRSDGQLLGVDEVTGFHRFVILTLNLLGLSALETEKLDFAIIKNESGSPIGDIDIIAFDPKTNTTFMFQCTTASPDTSKLDRTHNLRAQLKAREIDNEIIFLVKRQMKEGKKNSTFRIIDGDDWLHIWERITTRDYDGARAILLSLIR